MLEYRPDIDGLRAIAVLSVVFFHLGFAAIPGGFVGVDIFFVISGYLITSQLLGAMDRGTFSFSDFYERRVRRLLPALVPVLVFAAFIAAWRLNPRELIDFSNSLVSFCLFASNIFFMNQDSYFDGSSALTPLLHTWSLSVEEQYYLLFPAALFVVHAVARKRVVLAIAIIFALSLAFSIFAVEQGWANIAFYHPLSRFWELMIGSILATGAVKFRLGDAAANAISALCLAAMTASLLLISKTTPFPGAIALVPTLATAGLILCGQRNTTLVGRLLSLRPPVFIGKISYSLYLWHWPLLALLSTRDEKPGLAAIALVLLASIALATLSYLFVEKPFRSHAILRGKKPAFAFLAASIVVFGTTGIIGHAMNGLPQRFPLDIARYTQQVDRERNWSQFRYHTCFLGFTDTSDNFQENGCLAIDPARKNVLILGDSHAAQLYYGLKTRFPDINFLQVTSFSCYPLFDTDGSTPVCTSSNRKFLGSWLRDNRIDGLILAARWDDRAHIDRMIGQLDRYEALLANVSIVGPAPRLQNSMSPIDLVTRLGNMKDAETAINEHLRSEVFAFDETFTEALANRKVSYISLIDLLCKERACRQFDDRGAPVLMDNNHLTIEGSVFAAKAFDDFVHRQIIGSIPAMMTPR